MGSKIEFENTEIEGVYLGKINVFQDLRGKFMRLYDFKDIEKKLNKPVMEINLSQNSLKGTVRGLHYENTSTNSFKIIKCIKGSIIDKVVDIRDSSKSFLNHQTFELDEDDNTLLIISNKIAHGFQTLVDNSSLLYMHTLPYDKTIEGGINIFDPLINLSWENEITRISDRDKNFNFLDQNFNGI